MNEPSVSSPPSAPRPSHARLTRMLVASLAVHLAVFSVVLLAPQGGGSGRTVAFVDLTMPPAGAPAAPAPPSRPAPEPSPLTEPAEKPQDATESRAAEPAPAAAETAARPEPAASGGTSISLGIGRGYFGSLGEGETLKDEIREYYFEMVKRINERWWQRPEADDSRVGMVMVMIVLARDGKVATCQVVRSSGKRAYDEAVVAAVQAAAPFAPLPASFEGDFFQAPLRVTPPLSLMRIGEGVKGAVLR